MNAPVKNPPITFAEAFCKLQAEIKPAIKDATNPAFRSKYADLGAVWEAIKGPLHENGFSIIQSPDFEAGEMWLKTTILHTGGEKMEGRYPLRPVKQDPQGYGSALTYARRYSISAMVGVIADIDDDGNEASKANGNAPHAGTPPPPNQVPPAQQPNGDVAPGARNWVEQQKEIISDCDTLPELTAWLDKEGGGSWTNPIPSSPLNKLARSQGAMFKELKEYYLAKLNKI